MNGMEDRQKRARDIYANALYNEEWKFEFGVRERIEQRIKENLFLLKAVDGERAKAVIDSAQYQDYLKSKQWQATRERIFKRDKYVCSICGASKNLVVHHITYENLGAENDADLITLCKSCHGSIHANELENPYFLLSKTYEILSKWAATGTIDQKRVSEPLLPLLDEMAERIKQAKEIRNE